MILIVIIIKYLSRFWVFGVLGCDMTKCPRGESPPRAAPDAEVGAAQRGWSSRGRRGAGGAGARGGGGVFVALTLRGSNLVPSKEVLNDPVLPPKSHPQEVLGPSGGSIGCHFAGLDGWVPLV